MQTLAQLLPPAEIGTAQQEIPVAIVNTMHTLQLTTKELYTLACAMRNFNDRSYDDESPSLEEVALEELLANAYQHFVLVED